MPGVRQTRHFQQVANFRFARAVKYRRGKGNAFAETFRVFQQLVVARACESDLPDRRLGENFAEPAAQRLGFDFLAEQALQAVAQFLGSPAQVRFQNLSDVHTRRNAQRIQNDLHRSAIGHDKACLLRGTMRAITPLFPWRPAILSPMESLRFMAI